MDMVADPLVTAATHGRVDVVRLILSKLSDAEKMVQMLPEEIDGWVIVSYPNRKQCNTRSLHPWSLYDPICRIKSMALWCASYEGQQEVIEVGTQR